MRYVGAFVARATAIILTIASVGASSGCLSLIGDKGSASNLGSLLYDNQGITVISYSPTPASGSPILAGTEITVIGTGFVNGVTVTIDGVSCSPVIVISSNQLTCTATQDIPAGPGIIIVLPPDSSNGGGSGAPNTAPTISNIADPAASPMGTPITGIGFTFNEGSASSEDSQTATISFSSSNPSLISASAISVSGGTDSGATDAATLTPTITVTPAPNRIGTAVITVTVTDNGSGALTASDTFTVTFEPVRASNLKLWLKADAGTFMESSSPTTAVTAAATTVGAPAVSAGFTKASNQSLYANDNAATSMGNFDFSMATWFFMQTAAADTVVMAKYGNAGDREFRLIWKLADQKLHFQIFDGTTLVGDVASSATVAAGSWVFAYAQHDAANDQVGVSLNNGAIATAATTGSPINGAAGLTLSCDYTGTTDCMDGIIGVSGLWKKLLSAAEISELYNSGSGTQYSLLSAGIKTSMAGFWNLDETTSAAARNDSHGTSHLTAFGNPPPAAGVKRAVRYWGDQSGTGNHFTADVRRAPALVLNSSSVPTLRFNGITTAMTAPDTATLEPTTGMTVFWVNTHNTTSGGYEFLLSKTNTGTWTTGWALGDVCNSAGNMWQAFWVGHYGLGACDTATTATPYVVGARWDGKHTTLWYNGEAKKNTASTATPTYGAEVITLGSEPGLIAGNFYKGDASEFMIYDVALTNEEMVRTSAYLGYKHQIDITPSSGRRLWLKADSLSGQATGTDVTSWTDSSSAANHATGAVGVRPTYQTDALAGSAAVRFNGSKCLMTGAGDALTDYSAFVAYKSSGALAAYERLLDKNISTGFWMGRQNANASSWGGGALESATPWGVYGALTDGLTNLLSTHRQDTHFSSVRNGASVSSRVLASAAAMDTSAYGIGCDYAGLDSSVQFTGDIGEVMVYNTNLSEADRIRVGQQLATKYGPNVTFPAPYQVEGLTLWLKADSGITKDGASKVSEWADAGGRGANFVQAVGASQPTWVADGGADFNHLPVMRFSNSQQMTGTTGMNLTGLYMTTTAYTVYMVFKATTISTNSGTAYSNDAIWGDPGTGTTGTYLRSAGLILSYNWDGNVDSSSSAISTGNVYLARQRLAGGNVSIKVGDGAEASAATGAGLSLVGGMTIGNSYGGEFFAGDLAEFIFFNKDLSVAQQAAICGYLNTRYNLGLTCN